MTTEEIERLAKSDNLQTNAGLDLKLTELKSKGCRILECILYVKINQNCSLIEAKSIVVNSPTWISKKEDFIRHHKNKWMNSLKPQKTPIARV